MRTQRTRSSGVRASSRLALVIAREIELLATRRGRIVAFDIEEIQPVAERIAELVASTPPTVGLVDAQDLAQELGVARDWVYANAERLGAVRLGSGPRARLRFDIEQAREALAAGSQDSERERDDWTTWTVAQQTGAATTSGRCSGRSDHPREGEPVSVDRAMLCRPL
jgi:hypothetical protein